jgi:hypothetical protein
MLGSAVVIEWLGGEVWEKGYGPALALLTMVAIAVLCRRMTMEIFGALIVVRWLFEGAIWLLDADRWPLVAVGAAAMIATAYLLGDRPHRTTTESLGRAARVTIVCVALTSGFAVVAGAILAIANGSQTAARGLILFGSIVFAACVAPWLERRWGD